MNNLLRIKINNNSIIKFCESSHKQDFYCYFPSLLQDKYAIETHFSFHSKTGRTTFKTTSLKSNGGEFLPSVLDTVKDHPSYQNAVTPKDLDLYKGRVITFADDLTFYPWFRFALNLQNSNVAKYIGASKMKDSDFLNVLDVRVVPPHSEQITIKGFIGKNVKVIPEKKDNEYDLSLAVTERNFIDDKYTFIFCLSYDFPDIKN